MQINFLKKFGIGLLATLILLSQFQVVRPLETGTIYEASAQSGGLTGSEAFCRGADRDWSTFLSSVISYDDFTEYWKDVIVRYNSNICLYNDISLLLKRIEQARAQIRKAFYDCSPTATKLKENYYELEAELYFLRKYIQVGNDQIIFARDEDVRNSLKDYFVFNKGFFTAEKVDQLYTKFKAKYQGRQSIYAQCKSPTWENLIAKWNDVTERIKNSGSQFTTNISNKWNKAVNAPLTRTGNLLRGLLDIRINDIDPKTALSDIAAEMNKLYPSGYSFQQFQQAQANEEARYRNDLDRTTIMAQYEFLYKDTSGTSQNFASDRLTTLRQTIQRTFPPILQTYSCTSGIVNKTCGGASL